MKTIATKAARLLMSGIIAVTLIAFTACGDDDEPNVPADNISGTYTGKNTLTVGGQYSYEAEVSYKIEKQADGSLTVHIPGYSQEGTLMGDLTLGAYTVKGLKAGTDGVYTATYGKGLSMHLVSVNHGQTMMDGDYEFADGSKISVAVDGKGGAVVYNSFRFGSMPFGISTEFEGSR